MNPVADAPALLGLAAAWLAYGLIHSWLAADTMKRWLHARWPRVFPAYRLLFNVLAVVLLLPPLWLTWRQPGEPLWSWPAWVAWPAAAIAVAGFIWSLRWYDVLEFLGLRQWRERDGPGPVLRLSPLHRLVRHPWYSLGLLFLWTRDLNAAWLVSALAITAYVVLGSRLEERKLLSEFGAPYAHYRARVPALLPWPGQGLSRHEAAAIEVWARQVARDGQKNSPVG